MATQAPFDAVVFDLDGTLVATERFWLQAARAGARRAFEELELTRELPSTAQWMDLVGRPLERGFELLFPELTPEQRTHVRVACEAEEHRQLSAGGAFLMPGALELLDRLRARGVQLGIASNCTGGYLQSILERQGLAQRVHESRCIDSPGIGNKADMLADLAQTFGTRSLVMVGDRHMDRDAAWENGLPFVHCAFGFAAAGEAVEAEGLIEELAALDGVLEGRSAWLAEGLAGGPRPGGVLGIGGPPLVGKSLFARDAQRSLAVAGRPAAVLPLALFAGPGGLDLDRLEEAVLAPHARQEEVRVAGQLVQPGDAPEAVELVLEPGAVLILEGEAVADPALSVRLDRYVHLDAPDGVLLRRLAGRDGRALGLGPVERGRERLGRYRRAAAERPPEHVADKVLAAASPFG